jgi:hypothetical protein
MPANRSPIWLASAYFGLVLQKQSLRLSHSLALDNLLSAVTKPAVNARYFFHPTLSFAMLQIHDRIALPM